MLSGELDEQGCRLVRAKFDAILDSWRYGSVIVDMTELSFMDSSGIGLLIGRFKRLKSRGIPMMIANPNCTVDKIFRISGIYNLMPKLG